ncbi:hypothetical protein T484DRAFT_1892422 [Baffinella frigidus]|nr:hypothetical protein T484DRAFT_1892422 [Cryptophyta sp. CCMP2293]
MLPQVGLPDLGGDDGGGGGAVEDGSESEEEAQGAEGGRTAKNASRKYGYAPIVIEDLHGCPLPFSNLDAMIEAYWGPTVCRRKLLHPARSAIPKNTGKALLDVPRPEWYRLSGGTIRAASAIPEGAGNALLDVPRPDWFRLDVDFYDSK